MTYDWNFGRLAPYAAAFLYGTWTTVLVTVITIAIGTLLGAMIGSAVPRKGLGRIMWWSVDVFRAVPPLVLVLFMYYALTVQVVGVAVPSFWVAITALACNLAAFAADLVRAARENVDSGIIDAARSLGMSHRQVTQYIVLPAIVREVTPGMTVLYIGTLKMSSLAAVINVRELTYTAQTVLSEVARSLEAWTVVGLIYIALVLPATHASRRVESWARRGTERG